MRLLVAISRNYGDYESILDGLSEAARGISYNKVTVVHGASQMDWFVAGAAYALGMNTEPHKADWSKGHGAGFARNQRMVDLGADKCAAWIKNGSHGATDCADRAEKAGIPTKRFTR